MPSRMHNRYVAFLRGINVGGNKAIKMADLKNCIGTLGFSEVKTVLASGNVIFSAPKAVPSSLQRKLEHAIESAFGLKVAVVVRSISELQKLAASNPFLGVKITPDTRRFVTFGTGKLKTNVEQGKNPPLGYTIVRHTDYELCILFTASPHFQTPDLMSDLDRRFGRSVTTRTWATIEKILAAST